MLPLLDGERAPRAAMPALAANNYPLRKCADAVAVVVECKNIRVALVLPLMEVPVAGDEEA